MFMQPNGPAVPVKLCQNCGRRLWRPNATVCQDCCHHESDELEATRARNGVMQYRRRCTACGLAWAIKHKEIQDPTTVRVVTDYSDSDHPCARCRNPLTEYHHFAPQAIFGSYEAECWPGAWLCVECHGIWHRQMRLASGYRLAPEKRLREAEYTTPEQYRRDLWPGSPYASLWSTT